MDHVESVVRFLIPRQCIELLTSERADEQTLKAFVLAASNNAVAAILTLAELGKEVFSFPESTELTGGDFRRTLVSNQYAVENDPYGEREQLLQKIGGLHHYLSEGLRAADKHSFGFVNANDYWGRQFGTTNANIQLMPQSHAVRTKRDDEPDQSADDQFDTRHSFTYRTRVQPTDEQTVLLDAVQGAGGDGVIKAEAFAGTGKTTLCGFVGEGAAHGRVMYLAFNSVMASQANSRLGKLMECRTTDSLAYKIIKPWNIWGEARTARDVNMPWPDIADRLGLPATFGRFRKSLLVRQVYQTMKNYCYSSDVEMSLQHVPDLDWPLGGEEDVLRWAGDLWSRVLSTAENIPIKPETVMKVWDLQGGKIDADLVLFDEAQDANGAFMSILKRSECLRLLIGDHHQQLYEWRGAVDAMNFLQGNAYPLTRSWRFGHLIAEYANRILAAKTPPPRERIVGNPGVQSIIKIYDDENLPSWPLTILARTNAMVFYTAVDIAEKGHQIHIVGDVNDLKRLLMDALMLFRGEGGRVTHRMLLRFKDWDSLAVEYEMTRDPELKRIITIIEERNEVLEQQLDTIMRHHVSENRRPNAILATTHKVKGREWDRVMLMPDFICPEQFDEFDEFRRNSELNILYVAATRAINELYIPNDLPPNFHPAMGRVLPNITPVGAV